MTFWSCFHERFLSLDHLAVLNRSVVSEDCKGIPLNPFRLSLLHVYACTCTHHYCLYYWFTFKKKSSAVFIVCIFLWLLQLPQIEISTWVFFRTCLLRNFIFRPFPVTVLIFFFLSGLLFLGPSDSIFSMCFDMEGTWSERKPLKVSLSLTICLFWLCVSSPCWFCLTLL